MGDERMLVQVWTGLERSGTESHAKQRKEMLSLG
jgi:hypothetical protein